MTLRSISALKFADLIPEKTDIPEPEFITVDPLSLLVDATYQRDLSERSVRLIRKIVAGWDWGAFKPPVVVRVEGGLHVLDGQHTAIAAATHPAISAIPVMLVTMDSKEGRAGAFVKHNRDRIAVTALQLHAALVQAGDEDAQTLQNVCNRAGVNLLRCPPAFARFNSGDTMAISALQSLVRRRYSIGARKVLDVCVAAKMAPIRSDAMKAIEVLLFDKSYSGDIDPEALADTIRRMGDTAEQEAAVFAAAHKQPRWRGLVVVWFKNTRKTRKAVTHVA